MSFGKAFGASGLGSFEEIAREAQSGLIPVVGAIEVNSKSLGQLSGNLYWVRRELGPDKYGSEEIEWGMVREPRELETGYEFTIVPKSLNPENLRSMNTEIGTLDSSRQSFVYQSFDEYCGMVEGQRRWFEF